MEEGHYHHHHHHHHHHAHPTTNVELNANNQQQQQQTARPVTAPVLVPRPNEQIVGGVQAAHSFHSVSSIDSSAEMSKYFPETETTSLAPFSHFQEGEGQQTQSTATVITNTGPYATVPAPAAVQQHLLQPARAPVLVPQQVLAPKLPLGIPSYPSQIEALSVSETIVNDVIIDLQSKVINETQQHYYDDSLSGNYLEPLSPIYIRAPNPSIILRSDLHRLRAQFAARPQVVARHVGSVNQFQVPSFPPPQ